jgi:sigma-E factor negative regulatory protein RseC
MIEEYGRVVAVKDNMALIEMQRKSVCSACSANKGCGTGVLSKVIGNKRFQLTVFNSVNAGVGDDVIVGIEDDMLVKGSFAVYIIPLLLLFIGSWSGKYIAGLFELSASEGLSILFGMLGLFSGFVWLRHFTRKIGKDDRYRPVLLGSRNGRGIVLSSESFNKEVL